MSGDEKDDIPTEDLTQEDAGDNTPAAPEDPEGTEAGDNPSDESEDSPSQEGEQSVEDPEEGSEEPAADEAPVEDDKPELTSLQKEVERLRAERAEERRVMLELVARSQRQEKAPPSDSPTAGITPDVMKMALFGGPSDQWNAIPADVRAKALKLANDYVARTTQEALNPNSSERVEALVQERIAPLLEDYHDRKAREVTQRHFGKLDEQTKERAKELFKTTNRSSDWRVIEQTMEACAAKAKLESLEKKAKDEQNKVKAQKVQSGKTGGTKLKPGKPNGSAPKFTASNPPPMKPGERMTDYYERIKSLQG